MVVQRNSSACFENELYLYRPPQFHGPSGNHTSIYRKKNVHLRPSDYHAYVVHTRASISLGSLRFVSTLCLRYATKLEVRKYAAIEICKQYMFQTLQRNYLVAFNGDEMKLGSNFQRYVNARQSCHFSRI